MSMEPFVARRTLRSPRPEWHVDIPVIASLWPSPNRNALRFPDFVVSMVGSGQSVSDFVKNRIPYLRFVVEFDEVNAQFYATRLPSEGVETDTGATKVLV